MFQSYLNDTWVTPTADSLTDVRDAVTGDVDCRVSSAGLDLTGAFAHARRVGGPALRRLTCHSGPTCTYRGRGRGTCTLRGAVRALSVYAGATLADAR